MTTAASSIAQVLAQNTDDDVLQALQLYISLRPEFQTHALGALQQEPMRRYSGTITNFNREKGFGFIQSEEVTADFGKDSFVSDREIGHFNVGDTVLFTVVVNRDNKPQARLLQGATGDLAAVTQPPQQSQAAWVAPPPVAVVPPRHVPPVYEPPAKVARVEVPPMPPPAVMPAGVCGASNQAVQDGTRYVGTITSFMPEKHFGFIASQAVTAHFGRDTFLSDLEIGSFKVGDTVSFTLLVKNGKPQARNLQSSFEEVLPPNMVVAAGVGAGLRGSLLTPSQPAMALQTSSFEQAGEDPTRYVGVITTFMAERRYGFIQCEEVSKLYGKDTFLSDLEIGQNSVGSSVSFRVVLNRSGQPQARDVLGADAAELGTDFHWPSA
mmetsp:Transcript_56553/g.143065  ORF Transcript_56553/g.143065 Transcript_56553/m.143065 type:complete len:381 (-) Transcript_56553:245-1387(-)